MTPDSVGNPQFVDVKSDWLSASYAEGVEGQFVCVRITTECVYVHASLCVSLEAEKGVMVWK